MSTVEKMSKFREFSEMYVLDNSKEQLVKNGRRSHLVTWEVADLYRLTGDVKSGLEVWTETIDMSLSLPVLPCWTFRRDKANMCQCTYLKTTRAKDNLYATEKWKRPVNKINEAQLQTKHHNDKCETVHPITHHCPRFLRGYADGCCSCIYKGKHTKKLWRYLSNMNKNARSKQGDQKGNWP